MSRIVDLETAATLLLNGEIVSFPTETVYGLGALANNSKAINQVFEIKNRPKDNPLICHFYDIDQIKKFAKINKLSQILLHNFSPGPISLLLPLIDQKLLPATCGNPKIVCRIPKHTFTLKLLQKIKIPLVGPSANTSGFFSPTTAVMVLSDLGNKISGVLDGGNCQIGLESTILEVIGHKIKILRNGVIGKIEIEKYLQKIGAKYEFETQNENQNNSPIIQKNDQNLPNLLSNSKNNSKLENLQNLEKIEKIGLEKLINQSQFNTNTKNNQSSVIPGQKYAHYKPKTPFFIIKSFLQITKIIEEKLKQEVEKSEKFKQFKKQNKQTLEINSQSDLKLNSKLVFDKNLTNFQICEKMVIITTQIQLKKLNSIYPNLGQNQIEIINLGGNLCQISQNFYQTLFQLDQKHAKIGYLLLPKIAQSSTKIALWDKINKAGKYL